MSPPGPLLLKLHPSDHVAVALRDLAAGAVARVDGADLAVRQDIPRAHKVALAARPAGAAVVKYGQPIGRATAAIVPGDWVHGHNLRTALEGTEAYVYDPRPAPLTPIEDGRAFDGFVRSDGQVGIRNELWILPTVGCVNALAGRLAREFRPSGAIGGVHAFPHPYGCSQLGDDHRNTREILAALARHPNAAGVLVVGLGCENNTLDGFRAALGDAEPARLRFLAAQAAGDELAEGLRLLGELAVPAAACRRQPVPLRALRLGLKCGGSDAFSGITANPLVGACSDLLLARGGAAVLTEVPEMFGAEALFLHRCADRAVFDACAAMLNGFKEYYLRHGQPVYENPSPGNKEGGLTTLEEKSLGCLQKSGAAPIADVLPYAGRIRRPGLSLLAGPGNDIVSVTALAAAGAQLVLFTTGRGTPLGGPVPTLKIASTRELAERKRHWIDFDAGRRLEGAARADLAAELLDLVVDVASGRARARNEDHGGREIALFKDGVTL